MSGREKRRLLSVVGVAVLGAGVACAQPIFPNEQKAPPRRAEGLAGAPSGRPAQTVILHVYVEQRERAFSVLVPDGWKAEGGVLRVNPLTSNGSMNTVGAKVDFSVKKDAVGSLSIHWLPNFYYKDPRWLQGVSFPIGSSYMGMQVYPLPDAQTFLTTYVFQRERPRAQNVEVLERKPLPGLVRQYQQRAAASPASSTYRYDGGMLTVTYTEGGVRYKEKMVAVVEDTGQNMLGTWSNHDTLAVRAPVAEFERNEPLFDVIQTSLRGNPEWVMGEQRGSAQRAANALQHQRYMQDRAREIVERTRRTNAEIRHSLWLNLTGQEDYVNPHTGEVEQGSNQWDRRWVDGNGDVVYSNDPDYDPNRDPRTHRRDFKESRARKR